MRKSVIAVLTAIGGDVSYAGAIIEIKRDPGNADPGIWGWCVSSILSDQRRWRPWDLLAVERLLPLEKGMMDSHAIYIVPNPTSDKYTAMSALAWRLLADKARPA